MGDIIGPVRYLAKFFICGLVKTSSKKGRDAFTTFGYSINYRYHEYGARVLYR